MRVLSKAFLFTTILLLGLELIARTMFSDAFYGRFDYGYHPTAGFVEKPGKVEVRNIGGRKFWEQEFARQKPRGGIRIFTIGDSISRGKGLKFAYPHYLGELLRERGYQVESLNLSSPGYGVRRRMVVLEQALKYQPDLIILHLNDSNEFEDEREWRRAQEARSWHPDQWFMKSYVIARLHEAKTELLFWKLPLDIRSTREVDDHDAELAAEQNTETAARWEKLFRDKTTETVRLLQQRGVPVLLLGKAVLEAGKDTLDDQGKDVFINSLLGPGVYMVSTRAVFTPYARRADYFVDGTHWSPEGHRIMAKALLPIVEKAIAIRPGM